MKKKPLDSPIVQFLMGRMVGAWMGLAGFTTRWREINREETAAALANGGPVILCFWHGRIMLAHARWLPASRPLKTYTLISQSSEGEVISQAAGTLGILSIRGSTEKAGKTKGAFDAMREMIRRLKEGQVIAITPDGPRGPRMRTGLGAVQLAKLTGAPIVTIAWATSNQRVLRSWDRFAIPGLFGRGVYVFGRVLRVDRRADDAAMEAARLGLENELIRVTQEADRLLGYTPIEPADLPEGALAVGSEATAA